MNRAGDYDFLVISEESAGGDDYADMEYGVVPPSKAYFGLSELACRRMKYVVMAVAVLAMVCAGAFQVRMDMGDSQIIKELRAEVDSHRQAMEVPEGTMPSESLAPAGRSTQGQGSKVVAAQPAPQPVRIDSAPEGSNLVGGAAVGVKVGSAARRVAMEVPVGGSSAGARPAVAASGEAAQRLLATADAARAAALVNDARGAAAKKSAASWKPKESLSQDLKVDCPAPIDGVPSPETCYSWEGSTYYVVRHELTWDQAELTCTNLGGHLTSVRSVDENRILSQMLKQSFWVGLRFEKAGRSRQWTWADGSAAGAGSKWSKDVFSNWGHGMPQHEDHGGKADCVMANYHMGTAGAWADASCSNVRKRHQFICKVPGAEMPEEGGDSAEEGGDAVEVKPPTRNLSVVREL
mmetsp:Transcript_10356/g.33446  ORF Transcript_10356/g.33446 Transcript_10356/m.33446 type:complete len:408 (-) Transcript_10356:105-1328(-)